MLGHGRSETLWRRVTCGPHEQVSKKLRAPSCDLIAVTALGKPLKPIRPYRFEQSPATGWYGSIPRHKGLRHEVGDTLRDSRRGAVARDRSCRLERESGREDGQTTESSPLGFRQQFVAPV